MRRLGPVDAVEDILDLYRAVDRRPRGRQPWVVANMVCDLTGSVAIDGRVGRLSVGSDAELFRRLRTLADVVLVGAETVRRERYGPIRDVAADLGTRAPPPIAVVSRSLDFDWTIPLFSSPTATRPIVVTCEAAPRHSLARARDHAEVFVAGRESVDLSDALGQLADRGAAVVVCDGGPRLLGELVAGALLDELCLSVVPLMGGDPLPVAVMPPGSGLRHFGLADIAEDNGTLFLRYERDGARGS